MYPHTGKIIVALSVATATVAAGAAALVYSQKEHTTPPCEETVYDPQSSELVTGF